MLAKGLMSTLLLLMVLSLVFLITHSHHQINTPIGQLSITPCACASLK